MTPKVSPSPPRQEHSSAEEDPIAQATLRWIRAVVVGLNLCPWAAGALMSGNMRVLVYPPSDESNFAPVTRDQSNLDAVAPGQSESSIGAHGSHEGLVAAAAEQAQVLAALGEDGNVGDGRNATTLIAVRPPLASNFEEFLAVVEAVDDFIDAAGLRGTVQVKNLSIRRG